MCGIVGMISNDPVAESLLTGLIHLQHRGQDAAGILTVDQQHHFRVHQGLGLVREIFNEENLKNLTGQMGIGHLRYPTTGENSLAEVQPFWTGSPVGVAIAHNGNLTNYHQLSEQLLAQHRHLNSSSDSEVLLYLLADLLAQFPQDNINSDLLFFEQLCEAIRSLFNQIEGAYCVVSLVTQRGLIAFRDPLGIRPLVLGVNNKNDNNKNNYIIASEPTMFYPLGYELLDDIQPGEVVFISEKDHSLHRKQLITKNVQEFRPCAFEYIYFARPDAKINQTSVYRTRLYMGQNLAKKWQITYPDLIPDVVIPAPFTANTAALSFAHELGVRYSEGLYKNPFIGRTFIMPCQQQRKKSVRYKLVPQETEIKNKKVLILDDSIVRGTTSREIVRMIYEQGALSVYFVSAAPPLKFPCFYGINLPTRDEFIAAKLSIEEIKNYLGVDALLYQSIEDLVEAIRRQHPELIQNLCLACMTGDYPTDIN